MNPANAPGRKPGLAVTLALLCGTAVADNLFDELRDGLFSGLEKSKSAVFAARCGANAGDHAFLLFDSGKGEWRLIEEGEEYAINFSFIVTTPKGLVIEETMGGLYTYTRVRKLMDELTEQGFSLLAPFTRDKLYAMKPRKPQCKYIRELPPDEVPVPPPPAAR